ncbi:DMT family transporter [Candidatus Ozemobacteraceae bacterium]|nr:DMT family transporter [Candidatus Ozemobacteraceae bacterium]
MSRRTGILLLLVMNFVWGGSYAVAKWALQFMPPAMLLMSRFLLGGLVLLLVAPRPLPRISRRDWLGVTLVGALGITLAFLLNFWGLQRTTATKAAIEITLEPIILVLLARMFLAERLHPRTMAALAISLSGTFLLLLGGKDAATLWKEIVGAGELLGDILVLFSVALGGVYTVISKPVSRRIGAMWTTALSSLIGAGLTVPLAVWEIGAGHVIQWNTGLVLAILFLGLICTALGFALWNLVLIDMPAGIMAVTLNIQPLAGIIIGWLWLGETMTLTGYAGTALILGGVSLLPVEAPPAAPTPTPVSA